MSNAKLGTLHGSIVLDEPSRSYYGSRDRITGVIMLSYKPASSLFSKNVTTADLFGPLKIHVVLSGKVTIAVRRDRSHHMPTDHSMILFEQPFPVFDGILKAEVGDEFRYPFTAQFPEDSTSPYPAPGIGLYAGLMLQSRHSGQLPPTMIQHFSDYPDVVDFSVLYRLGAHVVMHGIDIKIRVSERETRSFLRYDLPRPPPAFINTSIEAFSLQAKVQNEYLLPEEERPSGFKAKAKAVFKSAQFPEFVADITCDGYQYIYPGQQLKSNIVLRRNDKASTAAFFPDISLESIKWELRGLTAVDTSDRLLGRSQCSDRSVVQTMACTTTLPQTFSKSNDYRVSVVASPLQRHTSSFYHQKVSRQYYLRLTLHLRIANKSFKQSREAPVIVVPPPMNVRDSEWIPEPPPEAGPSHTDLDDDLPAYGEAGSSKLLQSS